MTTYLITPRGIEAPTRLVSSIAPEHETLQVEPAALRRLDRRGREMESWFNHTPDPLIRSWRVSRGLMTQTQPGDTVITSDRGGLAGVFALAQWSLPAEERRSVWTLGVDSRFLEMRVVAKTHEIELMPSASVIDWEITQYRYSDRVLVFSQRAADELAGVGVDTELVPMDSQPVPGILPGPASEWWAPGPVSRRNQTGEILRALTSVPDARATLGTEDENDLIWEGTAWEALIHSRSLLEGRLVRSDDTPASVDVVVIGEILRPPEANTIRSAHGESPVVVPAGSAAARLWPQAPVWENTDDLATILVGGINPHPPLSPAISMERSTKISTAARVSVGVPVFRNVDYLDECVESILSQEPSPTQVILVDDGSELDSVSDALAGWAGRDRRIEVIETSHRGVCAARNIALEAMSGDCFLLLDSDDYLEPEFLARCTTMLRSRDDLWAVATWTRFFGTYQGIEAKPPFDRRVGLRENPVISTAVLADMAVRDQGIRFVPDLAFLFCEDWNVWSQIIAAGGGIGLIPEALVNHRVHQASGGHLRSELAHAVGKARATAPLRS